MWKIEPYPDGWTRFQQPYILTVYYKSIIGGVYIKEVNRVAVENMFEKAAEQARSPHPNWHSPKDAERFEHEFQPADHLYRWEMIVCPPVIYPIQIHGIVLEAGRNCVVVADFGLTGYGKPAGDDFNHADDARHQNAILAAFKKLRPSSEDQRLNIVTLTDPMDIRKWTKAHYDEHSFQAADKLEKCSASHKES